MTTIIIKNSSTSSAVPVSGDLTKGELAVNVTDKKLYTKDNGGSVVKLVGGLGNQEANAVAITGGAIDGTPIGGTTASTASFTTLSASGNVTLSGGTANGVLYLNGSKVATSGSALTFDGTNLGIGSGTVSAKLHVQNANGNNGSDNTGMLLVESTYASNASQANASLVAKNYYGNFQIMQWQNFGARIGSRVTANGGAGEVAFTYGNDSEGMRLTSTGLGIGTSSPGAKLNLSSTGGAAALWVTNTTASTGKTWKFNSFDDGNLYIGIPSVIDAVTITSSGNLGLGVTPSAWADMKAMQINAYGSAIAAWNTNRNTYILSNAYYAAGFKYSTTGGAAYYNCSGETPQHAWYIAASGTAGNAITFTQAMTLDASGNLGIGTTSPAYVLNTNYSAPSSFTNTGSNFTQMWQASGTNALGIALSTGDTTARFVTNNGYKFAWNLASTQAMTLDSSGNLLVGTTSALSSFSGARGTFVGTTGFVAQTNQDASYECGAFWHPATSGNNTFAIFGTEATYTNRGSITYNRAGGLVAYNTTSDYRAKDISGPIVDSGVLIDSVPVYMGKMKGATQERPMFIAHETPAYAHTGEKDAVDAEGNPVYQQMDASALIPVMWAEIQSLRARVAALES